MSSILDDGEASVKSSRQGLENLRLAARTSPVLMEWINEVEEEMNCWKTEYVEACRSLKHRVMQGAQAVYRAEAAEARLAQVVALIQEWRTGSDWSGEGTGAMPDRVALLRLEELVAQGEATDD